MEIKKKICKTLEGRSATFRVQGLRFFSFFLILFNVLIFELKISFLASITERFLVTFLFDKSIFLSRLGECPSEASCLFL